MRFSKKVAVVTGATTGIGREIAVRLVSEGARIVIVGRSEDALIETKQLTAAPGNVAICQADLRHEEEIERLVQFVHRELGEVDILTNVAGVWHNELRKYQGFVLAETAPAEILEVLEVGLRGGLLLTRALLPDMMKKRAGKVLFISCGFAGPHEAVGWVHYYVTNKAIESLTVALAAELRQYTVQVNCVAPWFVATEAVQRFYPVEIENALEPGEVANISLFLMSASADHISGQIVELRSKSDKRP